MRPYIVADWGVQRGFAPLRSFIIPQEWGTKGVDDRKRSALRIDSRLPMTAGEGPGTSVRIAVSPIANQNRFV
jgi:hypothetical protein